MKMNLPISTAPLESAFPLQRCNHPKSAAYTFWRLRAPFGNSDCGVFFHRLFTRASCLLLYQKPESQDISHLLHPLQSAWPVTLSESEVRWAWRDLPDELMLEGFFQVWSTHQRGSRFIRAAAACQGWGRGSGRGAQGCGRPKGQNQPG